MSDAERHHRPLRVTFVTQWFAPEPVTVPVWMARALRRLGADVRVLTGIPNFPTGRVEPGYRAIRSFREVIDGTTVFRTPLYPSHDSSPVRRIANYLSWAVTSTARGRRAFTGADVALVYSSPATAASAAMWNMRRRGVPYVVVVQDLWPDSIFASGFLNRPLVRRLVEPVVGAAAVKSYTDAARVVVISPGMRDLLAARGVDPARIDVIYNWVDEELMVPKSPHGRLKERLGIPHDAFLLMYGGAHGPAQALGVVVDAFDELTRRGAHAHLVLVGNGIEKELLRTKAAHLPTVHFLDPVPVAEMADLMAGADAQLVSLADDELFSVTMPSKVQSVLATGSAMLVVAPGDAAAVVVGAGAGMAANPGDPHHVADQVERLTALSDEELHAVRAASARLYRSEMSEDVGAARLLDALATAAGRSVRDHD